MAMLWVLNLADGAQLAARRSPSAPGLTFREVAAAAAMLKEHGLLGPAGPMSG